MRGNKNSTKQDSWVHEFHLRGCRAETLNPQTSKPLKPETPKALNPKPTKTPKARTLEGIFLECQKEVNPMSSRACLWSSL